MVPIVWQGLEGVKKADMSALVVTMWQNKLLIYTLKMITFFFRKIKKQIFRLPSAPPSRRVGGREIKTMDSDPVTNHIHIFHNNEHQYQIQTLLSILAWVKLNQLKHHEILENTCNLSPIPFATHRDMNNLLCLWILHVRPYTTGISATNVTVFSTL